MSPTLSAALASCYLIERQIDAGSMATVHLARDVKHDRRSRVEALTRMAALDSTSADAWHYLGIAYEDSLAPEPAIAAFRRSVRVDPTHRQSLGFIVLHCMWMRRYDSAAAWVDSAMHMDPAHVLIRHSSGLVNARHGNLRAAEDDFRAAVRLGAGPDQVSGWSGLADLAAQRADRRAVDTLLARAIGVADTAHPSIHDAAYLGSAFVAAGDRQRALRLLSRFEPRNDVHFQLHLQRDPQLDPLRSNPAFVALLTRGPVPVKAP